MTIEITQTKDEILPTAEAIAPIENNTSAGTPAANQKACVQLSVRCNALALGAPN